MANAVLKEFARVEQLSNPARLSAPFNAVPSSSKSPVKEKAATISVNESLDALLDQLRHLKQGIEAGAISTGIECAGVGKLVEEKKRQIDDRQKELYNAQAKLGKSLDKKFADEIPVFPPLFTTDESRVSLERVVALHFLRTGQFEVAEAFQRESEAIVADEEKSLFVELHSILDNLKSGNVEPALQWTTANRSFLTSRASPLEFYLHRSKYMRILTASTPPNPLAALTYARQHFTDRFALYEREISRLATCIAYLPLDRMRAFAAYADLASPDIHDDLIPLFNDAFCTQAGLSSRIPLRVVGDIGGGGALARIEKGRKVLRARRSEWVPSDELPIEIPLGPENRYHSVFACPVSKEQSTPTNPPMMMTCGHVVSSDSLTKLSKPNQRVKCPYCPAESSPADAIQVYF